MNKKSLQNNKPGSRMEREQKEAGKLYYT